MADVQSAWIAAGASIAVSAVSLGTAIWTNVRAQQAQREQAETARDLEALRSSLSEQNDAAKAKRDYEYDARKRLYTELYPLSFQLRQAALNSQNYIRNLALASRGGWLSPGADNWLTAKNCYYHHSLVYALMAPLAIYELMNLKLTVVDLRLDHGLQRQQFIMGKAFETLRSDFNLTDPRYPSIRFGPGGQAYAPSEDRLVALPPDPEQRWTWRQGLYSGQISQAVHALLTQDGAAKDGGAKRVMGFAEFTEALGGADLRNEDDPGGKAGAIKAALQPVSDLFRGFHPARRPVTWRILLALGACYGALLAADDDDVPFKDLVAAARYAGLPDRAAFDWIGDGARSIPAALHDWTDFAAEQDAAFQTADLFLQQALEAFTRTAKSA